MTTDHEARLLRAVTYTRGFSAPMAFRELRKTVDEIVAEALRPLQAENAEQRERIVALVKESLPS